MLQRAKGRGQAQTSRQADAKSEGGNGPTGIPLVMRFWPRDGFTTGVIPAMSGPPYTSFTAPSIVHLSTMAARKITPETQVMDTASLSSSSRAWSRHLLHHQHAKWPPAECEYRSTSYRNSISAR